MNLPKTANNIKVGVEGMGSLRGLMDVFCLTEPTKDTKIAYWMILQGFIDIGFKHCKTNSLMFNVWLATGVNVSVGC